MKEACTWFIFYAGHDPANQDQPDIEERLLNHPRFSKQPTDFRAAEQTPQFGLYVETHGDSRTLQKFVTRLITDFGYHEDDLTFEIFI